MAKITICRSIATRISRYVKAHAFRANNKSFAHSLFSESEQQIVSTLELQAERDPSYKDALLTKAHLHKKSLDDVKDREYFLKLINAVDLVLTEVEKQLQQEEGEQ